MVGLGTHMHNVSTLHLVLLEMTRAQLMLPFETSSISRDSLENWLLLPQAGYTCTHTSQIIRILGGKRPWERYDYLVRPKWTVSSQSSRWGGCVQSCGHDWSVWERHLASLYAQSIFGSDNTNDSDSDEIETWHLSNLCLWPRELEANYC